MLCQVANYSLTAVTTGLSLIGYTSVVPVPVALMSMLVAVSDFEQLAARLRNVNQCKMQLDNLLIWWESLSMVSQVGSLFVWECCGILAM